MRSIYLVFESCSEKCPEKPFVGKNWYNINAGLAQLKIKTLNYTRGGLIDGTASRGLHPYTRNA
jgi:hypothetical protein